MTYPVKRQRLSGWANYPVIEAEVATPANLEEVRDYILINDRLIARGNGKSYGDASLSPHVLSMLALNRIVHFDPATGIIECEAGVLLVDILRVVIPQGWFFYVTPGIKYITVGGAVASDVHGKNHPTQGCFSNWLISFELMTSTGEMVHCSKETNADLFWKTCGGMGWTGVILRARFQLRRIHSTQMQQHTVQASNWEKLYAALLHHPEYEYAAAWVDGLASGKHLGRGTTFFASHLPEGQGSGPLVFAEKSPLNVPFYAPAGLLNPLTIRMYNTFRRLVKPPGEQRVDLDTYFYPLDGVRNWNRLYGRRGFIQYQFCLPMETAFDGMKDVLQAIQKSPDAPFLTVLKRHGARPVEAVNSFPIEGLSLALDFPRTGSILGLVRRLDEIVWAAGGKVYLTKDAASEGKMGRVEMAGVGEKWWSGLRGRVEK